MSQDEEEGVDTSDVLDEWAHGKALIKPADQLELTDAVREAHGSLFLKLRQPHGLFWSIDSEFAAILYL